MQNTSTSSIYEQKWLAGLHDISIFPMITESQAKRNKQNCLMQIKGFRSNLISLILADWEGGVVKDTRGQGRLRKAHTTVTT